MMTRRIVVACLLLLAAAAAASIGCRDDRQITETHHQALDEDE